MLRREGYVRRGSGQLTAKQKAQREKLELHKDVLKSADQWLAQRGLGEKTSSAFIVDSNQPIERHRFHHKRQQCGCVTLFVAIARCVVAQARHAGLVTTKQDRREFLLDWKARVTELRDTRQDRTNKPRAATIARQQAVQV